MNTHKTEQDQFLNPTDTIIKPQQSIHNPEDNPTFPLPEFIIFHPDNSPSNSSSEHSPSSIPQIPSLSNPSLSPYINPEPYISSQFYTFNSDSHSLMILCLREGRLATPSEIRIATPKSLLKSWRSVWKDRSEDTAYLTAWKRIQDKLTARLDPVSGNEFLCFKNNPQQFVSHINQWQDIVIGFHIDTNKHLGVKETIDKIKQIWTVGAKFYGIPESFIRVCVSACDVCNSESASSGKNKRRRFEYTESIDVPAKDVSDRLQQLATKYKVVLCIRQKYIRNKPFMAEVKDYACHRAGEPVSKRAKVLKREPYQSKRCGCGFRIRAIVPIANYNEKDKTFVYQEEGTAVFKLYAVHSGHEPGALDGNARIMHRVVGHKGILMDQDIVYGVREEELDTMHCSVINQVQELRSEVSSLEGRIGKIPEEMLESVSRELFEVLNKIRNIGVVSDKAQSDEVLVGDDDDVVAHWSDHHHHELIEDDEESYVVPWEQIRQESVCREGSKDLCKPEKWLKCNEFDESSEDSKLRKHEGVGLVGVQVDTSFYQENSKWYDSP